MWIPGLDVDGSLAITGSAMVSAFLYWPTGTGRIGPAL